MQLEIQIDENCSEPKVIIVTNQITDEVDDLIKKISQKQTGMLAGFKDDKTYLLKITDIYRIFSSNGGIFAVAEGGEFKLRARLYEIETNYAGKMLIRISNSEIINLKKAENFDLNFKGTICVKLKNGDVSYVSRRYVSKIKKLLGI